MNLKKARLPALNLPKSEVRSSVLFKMKNPILLTAFLWMFAFSAFADPLVDSINQYEIPDSQISWAAADVGWEYTPSVSYALTGVFTKFSHVGYGDTQTVTVEVYDSLPDSGGSLLCSADFIPTNGTFSGASFQPVNLIAGHTYFIGFRNVAGLGVNVTPATNAIVLSPLYYSSDEQASYSIIETGPDSSNPILDFYGHDTLPPKEAVAQLISVVEATDIKKTKKEWFEYILLQAENEFGRNKPALGVEILKCFQDQVRMELARTNATSADLFIETAQAIIDEAQPQHIRRF